VAKRRLAPAGTAGSVAHGRAQGRVSAAASVGRGAGALGRAAATMGVEGGPATYNSPVAELLNYLRGDRKELR
jgi:hypothetical protein